MVLPVLQVIGTPATHKYVCGQVDDAAFTEVIDPLKNHHLQLCYICKEVNKVDVGVAYQTQQTMFLISLLTSILCQM